jgi:hypothetical protein
MNDFAWKYINEIWERVLANSFLGNTLVQIYLQFVVFLSTWGSFSRSAAVCYFASRFPIYLEQLLSGTFLFLFYLGQLLSGTLIFPVVSKQILSTWGSCWYLSPSSLLETAVVFYFYFIVFLFSTWYSCCLEFVSFLPGEAKVWYFCVSSPPRAAAQLLSGTKSAFSFPGSACVWYLFLSTWNSSYLDLGVSSLNGASAAIWYLRVSDLPGTAAVWYLSDLVT